jgi:hypothetical protein
MTRHLGPLTPDQARALTLDTEPYLSCEECFDLMDSYVDAQATGRPDPTPPGLLAHLAGCSACAEEVESLRELVAGDEGGH